MRTRPVPEEKNSEKKLVKDGELRAPVTRCDLCGDPSAVILSSGKARCAAHVLSAKEASTDDRLKSAGEKLSDLHKA